MDEIEIIRRHYAEGLGVLTGRTSRAVVEAFAKVPRERFLGPGPWQIASGGGYLPTPDDDPRHVYHDTLIALVPRSEEHTSELQLP